MNKQYNGCKCNDDHANNICECDKYKKKSDELYIEAQCIQDEAKKFICEARELENQARELERRARELCEKSNINWDQAKRLESEVNNLLDLSSFYCHKASECYKDINSTYACKTSCNSYNTGFNCNHC